MSITPLPRWSQLRRIAPPISTEPVSFTVEPGVTFCSSRPAAIVTTFMTEPGSYWFVTWTLLYSVSCPGR